MIALNRPADINWNNVIGVAYRGLPVTMTAKLDQEIDQGQAAFEALIEQGVPCYGVTTGLGQLVTRELDEAARRDLPRNILRARAAGIGAPLPKPVVRSIMLLRLVNFLSGADGVSSELCHFIIDRLNDNFTPWVPSLGHGMAADAVANTHCFQTLIGEGSVMAEDGSRRSAADALKERGVAPYEPGMKEGLALLNGIAAGPAIAIHGYRTVRRFLDLANMVACTAFEALAAPKDSVDVALLAIVGEPGVAEIIKTANQYLHDSEVKPVKLQASVSARIFPQVHGALSDVLLDLKARIESTFTTFSDNPLMVVGDETQTGRFLSNGNFHNQHLNS